MGNKPNSSIKLWVQVEDGSKLELSVVTTAGNVTANAWLHDDAGHQEDWTDAELNPGPKVLAIRSPRAYSVSIDVALLGPGSSSATIRARIIKPDGSLHGDAYDYTVAGTNTTRSATILITTKK